MVFLPGILLILALGSSSVTSTTFYWNSTLQCDNASGLWCAQWHFWEKDSITQDNKIVSSRLNCTTSKVNSFETVGDYESTIIAFLETSYYPYGILLHDCDKNKQVRKAVIHFYPVEKKLFKHKYDVELNVSGLGENVTDFYEYCGTWGRLTDAECNVILQRKSFDQ